MASFSGAPPTDLGPGSLIGVRDPRCSANRSTIAGFVAVSWRVATISPASIIAARAALRRRWSTNWVRRVSSFLVSPLLPAPLRISATQFSNGSLHSREPEDISDGAMTGEADRHAWADRNVLDFMAASRIVERRGRRAVRPGTTTPLQPGRAGTVPCDVGAAAVRRRYLQKARRKCSAPATR